MQTSLPFAPMGGAHINQPLGLHVYPSGGRAAARKNESVRTVVIDNG